MKSTKVDNPPKNLSLESRRMWVRIREQFDLTADAALILDTALSNRDMAERARAILRKEGLVVNGKRHPCVEIAKSGDGLFMRGMRELGLNISEAGDLGRPVETLATPMNREVAQEELGFEDA